MKRVAYAVLTALAVSRAASAGEVLDRVRHDNVLRCAAQERPLVAAYRPDGGVTGIAFDFCRAVAIAVLGRDGQITFSIDGPVHNADLSFVSESDGPNAGLLNGPRVFVDHLAILVPISSRVNSIKDLAGETVCLMIASPEQSALEASVRRLGIDIVRLAFEEDVEMRDAYAVGRCGAMVGAGRELSELVGPIGINRLTSRLLAEPLAEEPIVAAANASDHDWADLVFGLINVLNGGKAPIDPAALRPAWREDVRDVLRK